MKRISAIIWIVLALSLTACNSATADRDEESNATGSKPATATRKAPPPAPKITIPTGTHLSVVLDQAVGTDISDPGSEFLATLTAPVVVDGRTVLESGAHVRGRVVDVKKAGRVKGRASLSLALVSVERNGKSIPIDTQTYVGVANSDKKRDAAIIAGGAGVGAAIGAITGGGKGAATGAAIGGAGGTGAVLATRGDDLHYPPETRLSFVLAKPAEI